MQKMTPTTPGGDPSQQKMMQFMPLIFGFMFYNLSSGLVLYYLTSNLVGIAQQWFFNQTSLAAVAAQSVAAAEKEKGWQEVDSDSPKYSVSSVGSRIEQFPAVLVWISAGFRMGYELADGDATDDDFETPDVVVKFTGPDVEYLLANRAELLLALEHVTMEALRMPSEDHSRISFDANDYRLLRIEELRMSAAAAAEKVKRTGQPFRFNPMNSRERRVIHLALRNETDAAQRIERIGRVSARGGVSGGHAELPELPPPAYPRRDGPSGGGRGDFGRDRGGPGRGDRGGRPQRRGRR